MRTLVSATLTTLLVALPACSSTSDDAAGESEDAVSAAAEASEADQRKQAFSQVRAALTADVEDTPSIHTETIAVDETTPASTIAKILPAMTDAGLARTRGETPEKLKGVYWMRGNPLPDYLLSFANAYWTEADATPYAYLSTFAPTSFAWKERTAAQGASDAADLKFLPESCRVPREDATLARLGSHPSTYDSKNFLRPIADDFAEIDADPTTKVDPTPFIDGVWNGGQSDGDGTDVVSIGFRTHAFYEAKFNAEHTEAKVLVVFIPNLPAGVREVVPPVDLRTPELLGVFSFAPHPGDKDIYVRKSYIRGLGKSPNYYFLTRILDANGAPTGKHFDEFLRCAKERSGGRILKVVSGT